MVGGFDLTIRNLRVSARKGVSGLIDPIRRSNMYKIQKETRQNPKGDAGEATNLELIATGLESEIGFPAIPVFPPTSVLLGLCLCSCIFRANTKFCIQIYS